MTPIQLIQLIQLLDYLIYVGVALTISRIFKDRFKTKLILFIILSTVFISVLVYTML